MGGAEKNTGLCSLKEVRLGGKKSQNQDSDVLGPPPSLTTEQLSLSGKSSPCRKVSFHLCAVELGNLLPSCFPELLG